MPIADSVDDPLLPSGISELPVRLNAELVYLFSDEDGTDAAHFIGEFALRVGESDPQELTSREAVVWITHRDYQGHAYRHVQALLWQDAEVVENGGTVTSGPALFVTLNTFGEITTDVDDLAFQSSADSQVYREGNAIRKAVAGADLRQPDEDVSLRVLDTTGLTGRGKKRAPKPPILFHTPGEFTMSQVDDRQVITVIGGAYLSRGAPGKPDYLEIRADSVVVFLPRSEKRDETEPSGGTEPAGLGTDTDRVTGGADDRREVPLRQLGRPAVDRQVLSAGFGQVEIDSVYLEGDVLMSQGPNAIRASRLYYDFVNERALILDAVVRAALLERNIPLYMRAAEIRQLSANHYAAENAILTTSEFYTPHYHIGARHVDVIDRTPSDASGRPNAIRAGSFRINDATLNLLGHPIAYWPYLRGKVDTSETALSGIRSGYSDDFGYELETDWHLFNLLNLEVPEGFDATLSLDYFSERGPAIGVDAEYQRDRYFGLVRGYLMADEGDDSLGRKREHLPHGDIRGRLLLRHRQYLEEDWQLSLELSYICDEGFLEEYFESEFDHEKDQETLLYLKKQRDNWAFTALLQSRILDFTTQTERLPDFSFRVIGESLGDRLTWFSENRAGIVRRRPADQTFRELLRDGRAVGSGSVLRADTRQEIGAPIDLGALRLVPFAAVRGSTWDDSVEAGGLARAFGTCGVRGSMYLWRTYPDASSSLFDIDGVRHIIKPDITAWVAHSNRDSTELFPFDETVEGIDEVDGIAIGLRQRWQTKRGQGASPWGERIVDFLTLDIEVGLFNDADGDAYTNGFTSFSRPETSIPRNYVNSSLIWRVNDRTALLSELNYDINDGELDIFNVSLAVERPPRSSYLLGYRYIQESESNLLGFDMNYRLSEKHTFALRELFDLDRGRTLDFTVAVIRKFPRWFGAISFELDDAEDDFGVSVSLWPEGLPQAALGSRRFTGLAQTTRIQPR